MGMFNHTIVTYRPLLLLVIFLSCVISGEEKEFISKDGQGVKPKMPYNFSWVIDGNLAAMGFPNRDSNIAFLIQNGITRLITLMEDWKPDVGNFPEMSTLSLEVDDFDPPTLEQIEQCIDYIEESFKLNKAVGIHCFGGRGRTGTVISCYFVKAFDLDPDEAIKRLRSIRPGSVESREQEEMVRTYSKHLQSTGKQTVTREANTQNLSKREQVKIPCT